MTVATGASVTRILFENEQDMPRAVGVEFAAGEQGPRFRVKARKEVVLS